MIPIRSAIEGKEAQFADIQQQLDVYQFTLGGNWDYKNGSFDRALDEANKVWLRIPFETLDGHVDSELSENNALIRLGEPYVLRHLYNEGIDTEATVGVVNALFNQFQTPVNPDAKVDARWVDHARDLIQQVEGRLLS